ncbi:MAG: putative branched-chain amino acid transporter, amino acid-binding protein [Rhizobacter sp.]|nr:putative branched-chain amino acid transporter, amino acid-binding protein [Rhizobacter sp.]
MSVRRPRRRQRLAVPAVLLSVALMTAACGSDSDSASSASSGSGTDNSSLLGTANKATGDPVKIGWMSTGQTQATDTTDEIRGAKAVVAYANAHLGGLAGRPIELVVCEDKATPAGAQACGNQFVTEGVAAVASGSTSAVDGAVQIVAPAGIPFTANLATTQTILGTKNVFVFTNPLSAFGTPAAYAREKQISSAAVVVIDVPAASGPARALSPAFFGNVNASAQVIAIPPGTADMTPQVEAAQGKKPGMWHLAGDPTFCSSALRAIRTLAIDAPVTMLDRCIAPDGGASIPGGYKGVTVIAQAVQDPEDKEFQLYQAVLDKFGDGLTDDGDARSGFAGMLSLIRGVNAKAPAEVTSESISTALQTMPATPLPIGGGATFQCNGQAIPAVSPNICATAAFVADADAAGKLSNFRTLDSQGIYKLGG